MELICIKDMFSDNKEKIFTKGKVYKFMEFFGAIFIHDDLGQEHDVNGRLRGLGKWSVELIEEYFANIPEEEK